MELLVERLAEDFPWQEDVSEFGRIATDILSRHYQFAFSITELTQRGVEGQDKNSRKAQSAKARADQLVSQGKYQEALIRYTTALKYSKDTDLISAVYSARLHSNRALCSQKLGTPESFTRAEEDSTAAICLDVSFCKAYYRRSAAREAQGRLSAALRDVEQALQLCPNSAEMVQVCERLKAASASEAAGSPAAASAAAQTACHCGGVHVDRVPGEGLAYVASRPLLLGEVVMADLPFAALPGTEQQEKVCCDIIRLRQGF